MQTSALIILYIICIYKKIYKMKQSNPGIEPMLLISGNRPPLDYGFT